MKKIPNDAIIKNLKEFGLGEKEANIYLVLLELEIATASQIAKATNINRSSTYVVLESLKEKGLVSISEDNNIQRYVGSSPDILLFEAQTKAQKAQDLKNNISDIVPELKALHKDTKQKPKVRVFEGKQGLINALEDTLHNKENVIRLASSLENLTKVLPHYFPDYLQKRIKIGITTYGIYPDNKNKLAESLAKKNSKFDKAIFILPKKYPFLADMAIYDTKIAYISVEKTGTSIIIESKEMADVMKNIFDLAYKEARRLNNINKLVTKYKESLDSFRPKK